MSRSFSFDPSTGQEGTSLPTPGEFAGAAFTGPGYIWNPQQYPNDPHDEQFVDVSDEPDGSVPVDGPLPENIHGERSYRRAAGEDWTGGDGFGDSDFDDSTDGDDDPHAADVDVDDGSGDGDTSDEFDDGEGESDDESDFIAENIITGRSIRRPVAPGPTVVLPTRGRPRR